MREVTIADNRTAVLAFEEDVAFLLLSKWVSELTPAFAYQNGALLGLTFDDGKQEPSYSTVPIVVSLADIPMSELRDTYENRRRLRREAKLRALDPQTMGHA